MFCHRYLIWKLNICDTKGGIHAELPGALPPADSGNGHVPHVRNSVSGHSKGRALLLCQVQAGDLPSDEGAAYNAVERIAAIPALDVRNGRPKCN